MLKIDVLACDFCPDNCECCEIDGDTGKWWCARARECSHVYEWLNEINKRAKSIGVPIDTILKVYDNLPPDFDLPQDVPSYEIILDIIKRK